MANKKALEAAFIALGTSFEHLVAELQSMGADPVLIRLAVSQQRESLATVNTALSRIDGNSK
ncbi:MAG: hypothetical protein ACRDBQ_10405 [Shewanella sp.]